jgi:hypothetical protein
MSTRVTSGPIDPGAGVGALWSLVGRLAIRSCKLRGEAPLGDVRK